MQGKISALRVIGSNVEVDKNNFLQILEKIKSGALVTSTTGLFSKKYIYKISYKGYIFFYQSKESLPIPESFTVIVAEKIYSPLTAVH